MVNPQVKVNKQYSIARDQSQYICTFHAVESNNEDEQKQEEVKTFPCVLSMHEYLTEEAGYCGNELMIAVNHLLSVK